MRKLWAPILLLPMLFAMACARNATIAPTTGAAVAPVPADSQVVANASVSGWTRPLNVAPLTDPSVAADSVGGKNRAGAGKFDVISDTPWPGDKVRVFFWGIQA